MFFCFFLSIAHSDTPPVAVVRKFVHLLEQNEVDLSEELGKYEERPKIYLQRNAVNQIWLWSK